MASVRKTSMSVAKFTLALLLVNLFISICLVEEANGHHVHIPLRYRKKLKYAAKLGVATWIAATKKVWIPLPVPFPIPIPIFKTYQPILVKKKLWYFGGFGHGLGFGGLHGGLGLGGFGYG